jgi:small-conductance mechanosensitive channel
MAFIVLPVVIIFPFLLVYLATSSLITNDAYDTVITWKATIRRPLVIVYRTSLTKRWGAASQMLRRLILVITATFTQIPQTVRTIITPTVLILLCVHRLWSVIEGIIIVHNDWSFSCRSTLG